MKCLSSFLASLAVILLLSGPLSGHARAYGIPPLPELQLSPSSLLRIFPESFEMKIHPPPIEIPAAETSLLLQTEGIVLGLRMPQEGLRLEVREQSPGQIRLLWSGKIRDLECRAPKTRLSVPKGFLERAFDLTVDSARIRFAGTASIIKIDASILLSTSDGGLEVEAEQVRIRFPSESGTEPKVEWGSIRVDGKPLVPETSRLQGLLKSNVPRWFRTQQARIETGLANILVRRIREQLETIPKTAVFALPPPLAGLHLQVTPARFLTEQSQTIRVSLQPRVLAKTPVTIPDRQIDFPLSLPGMGALVPENTLQELLSTPGIQDRLQSLMVDPESNPGVGILPQGIQIRLLHELRAISILLPLEIDLIRTIGAGAPLGERLRISFGDWIESWFGSGSTVKVPVEILLYPQVTDGSPLLRARIPFSADGEYSAPEHCPAEICPSNVERMSRRVRKSLMRSLYSRFRESVPETIPLPENTPKNIEITPENSLWLSTEGT
jgi:hypothetical protein